MRHVWKALIVVALLLALLPAGAVRGSTYTGQLVFTPPADAGDGMILTGKGWPTYTGTFSWTVSNTDTSHPGFGWKYEYEFKLASTGKQQYGLSHLIIETSPTFDAKRDMTGLTGATLETTESLQKVSSGDPNMPSDTYGLRFDPVGNAFDMKWSFYSSRAPTWGDFYAKGGGNPVNTAWNKGFTANDTDPLAPWSNGSVEFSILRPDTVSSNAGLGAVPLPSSLLMGLALLLGLGLVRHLRHAEQ